MQGGDTGVAHALGSGWDSTPTILVPAISHSTEELPKESCKLLSASSRGEVQVVYDSLLQVDHLKHGQGLCLEREQHLQLKAAAHKTSIV